LNCGRDIVIFRCFFKMAAAAILDFRNLKFLTVGTVKRVELRHHAKFRWNRPERDQNIAIYRFFQMSAAAILDFKNFKFLTVGTVKRVAMLHHAKFRQNRSNHGWNMALVRFLKMAAAAILDFRNFKFLTVGRSRGSDCIIMSYFVKIDPTAAEIWRFFDFSRWRPQPSWIFEISNF